MKDEDGLRAKELSVTAAASNSVILSKQEEEGKIQKLEYRNQGQINNQNEFEVNSKNKLYIVTAGLQRYTYKQLVEQISKQNCITIADYILMQKTEVNLADTYRANILTTLISLSKLLDNKPFKTMTRDDILYYLDTVRKPEVSDPQHKWIGSYNEKRQRLVKFMENLLQVWMPLLS